VSDREVERRLKDNKARTAWRHRAAARARKGALATLTVPEVLPTPEALDGREVPAADTRQVLLFGSAQADHPTTSPPRTNVFALCPLPTLHLQTA